MLAHAKFSPLGKTMIALFLDILVSITPTFRIHGAWWMQVFFHVFTVYSLIATWIVTVHLDNHWWLILLSTYATPRLFILLAEIGLQFICLIIGRVYLDNSLMVDLVSYRCYPLFWTSFNFGGLTPVWRSCWSSTKSWPHNPVFYFKDAKYQASREVKSNSILP